LFTSHSSIVDGRGLITIETNGEPREMTWKNPSGTFLLRWAQTIRPATLHALNDRVVQLAHQARVTSGRKLRIDGTAVQTVIHHPTDSSLLADGVRVLSRLIRRSKPFVQETYTGVRDAFRTRMRTMRGGVQTLHRLRRRTGDDQTARRVAVYTKLVAATRATVTQAQGVLAVLHGVGSPVKRHADRLQTEIARYIPLVEQVISQTERRVFAGEQVPAAEKLVSLFEPHTRIVPRHKGGAAVEFGRLVVIDEVEGGIVTRFAVLADKTGEQGQLAPALAHHRRLFGKAPRLVTGDRGLHAAENEVVARAAGVRHLVIPRLGKLTATQRADEHTRSWRRRYHWRAGIEGRLSSLRRDYGLRDCPDHGEEGVVRRVGWGIIASNLRHIGQKLAA